MTEPKNTTERTGPSKLWWVAAAFVAAVVLMLAAVLWKSHTNHDDTDTSQATPTEAASSAAALPAPQQSASGGTEQSVAAQPAWTDKGCNGHTSSPQGTGPQLSTVTWTPYLTAALPSSPTLGPAKTTGDDRSCYAHSPAGAVMAAVNLSLLENATDGQQIIAKHWTAGAGRDQAQSDMASSSHQPGNITGYNFAGCTATRCNVGLAATQGGQYIAIVVPMLWQNGDWYVDGSVVPADSAVTTTMPSGFTQWGPAS